MNLHAEFCRLWKGSPEALTLLSVDRIFTGLAPDKFEIDGTEQEVNPPYISVFSQEGDSPGGTSKRITQTVIVQFSVFATTRAQAIQIRNFIRDFFEEAEVDLGDRSTERFEDMSVESSGEFDEEDGIFQAFQRFTVEFSISRPKKRKG